MSFELTIENNNATNHPDDDTYVAVLTRAVKDGPFSWYDPSTGGFREISTADNTHQLSQYEPGSGTAGYADYFFKLSDLGKAGKLSFDQDLIGARLYISLGAWLPIHVFSATEYSPPSSTNPVLPGYRTVFDKIEFTYQPNANGTDTMKLYVDTTSVDFLAIPMTLSDGTTTVGYTKSRSELIEAFQKCSDPDFAALVIPNPGGGVPLRILSPSGTAVDMGNVIDEAVAGRLAQYLTQPKSNYVEQVWSAWTAPSSLTMQIGADTYTGQVDTSGTFNFHAGTALKGPVVLALTKPSSPEVLGCNGKMAAGTDAQKNIEKFLAAAMVRTVAHEPPGSGDPWSGASADFYTNAPVYHYARILHESSRDGLCYAFSYDDVCEQSSTIRTNAPTISLGLDAW